MQRPSSEIACVLPNADGVAVVDRLRDIGKRQGRLRYSLPSVYTLGSSGTLATRFQGSNSSMRLMG